MGSSDKVSEFFSKLRTLIPPEEEIGFEVDAQDSSLRLGLLCSPLMLRFEQTPSNDVFVYLQCRGPRSFSGDRTDLHDIFSWVTASFLWRSGVCSSSLIDIEHPFSGIPSELYGRYIIPTQGAGYLLFPDDTGLEAAAKYVDHLTMLEVLGHHHTSIWHPDPMRAMRDRYDPDSQGIDEWAAGIADLLQDKADPEADNYFQRDSTNWLYYRTVTGDVAVADSTEVARLIQACSVEQAQVAGVNGFLYTGRDFDHFVSQEVLQVADRLLEQDGALAQSGNPAATAAVVPLEDGVLLSHGKRVVLVRDDTGESGFTRERSVVLERNRVEQERLFPPSSFEWSEDISDNRFERLIYDLLEREPGVREVRAVGPTREADGGRDLVVSWVMPVPSGTAVAEGETPSVERRVIIQCKVRKRSVGRRDLGGGVLDTLYLYHGEGYFLAVSSQLASSAFDLLDEIRRRGDYFTGWWGRYEIEERLRRNPQVLRRYPDLVRPIF